MAAGNNNIEKTPQELAVAIQGNAKTLVPMLLRALREVNDNKRHEVLLEMFRMVDSKQTEYEIYQRAFNEVVTTKKIVGKKDGKDVVKIETTKSRNINHLVRTLGHKEVAEIIRLLLVNVNNAFNIKNGLNLHQVNEIADDIIEIYGSKLFIDELIYIFKKAKTTAQLFQSLDGSVIFRWIDDHYKMKQYHQIKQESQYKSEGFDLPKLPNGMLKQAAEKLQEKFVHNMLSIGDVPNSPINEKKKKKKT